MEKKYKTGVNYIFGVNEVHPLQFSYAVLVVKTPFLCALLLTLTVLSHQVKGLLSVESS